MIQKFFTTDHRRLDALLRQAFGSPPAIDENAYGLFRIGLLRHIALEEKILIPGLQARYQAQYPPAARLRLEHGAIAALLVLPPSETVKNLLVELLRHHNTREESTTGLYRDCDCLLSDAVNMLMNKATSYPDVPVMPYNGSPHAYEAARHAVERAGFQADTLVYPTPTKGELS